VEDYPKPFLLDGRGLQSQVLSAWRFFECFFRELGSYYHKAYYGGWVMVRVLKFGGTAGFLPLLLVRFNPVV
jgi:hypothetical protein